jgi:hypothetical protein
MFTKVVISRRSGQRIPSGVRASRRLPRSRAARLRPALRPADPKIRRASPLLGKIPHIFVNISAVAILFFSKCYKILIYNLHSVRISAIL